MILDDKSIDHPEEKREITWIVGGCQISICVIGSLDLTFQLYKIIDLIVKEFVKKDES